jgi:DNA-binding transcriptional LysR family regulator
MADTPLVPFADLRLLTVLAQTHSYTKAAELLGISKASASARIVQLERLAGVPLVRRNTRSVSLTEPAEQLVRLVQGPFAAIEDNFAGLRDTAVRPRGLIRVTAPVALGRQHITPVLSRFLADHPEIQIDLDLNDRLVNLTQDGFDLAVRHSQDVPETHVAWPLCASRSYVVASPDYLARHGRPEHPGELGAHRCIQYLRGTAHRDWSFHRARGRRREQISVSVQGPLRANNSEVIRDAVLAGVGVGLLPDFSAASSLARGELVRLLADWEAAGTFGDRIFAVRPRTRQVTGALRLLVDQLRAELSAGFPAEGA